MKKIGLIVGILCLLIIGIVMSSTYTEQEAWDELLALDSNVTMDDVPKSAARGSARKVF